MSVAAAQSRQEVRLYHDILPKDFRAYAVSEKRAYAIQNGMITHCNRFVIGWKLGATLPAAMKSIGIKKLFMGPLFEDFCHKNVDIVRAAFSGALGN